MTESEQSSHLHDDERIPRTARTTPQGMLADEIEKAWDATEAPYRRALVAAEVALRLSASPAGNGGREALEAVYKSGAESARRRDGWHDDVVIGWAAWDAVARAMLLTPAVAPDGAREPSLRALVQELFDFTTPVGDAEKFLALSAMMAESGWWNRAKAALALPAVVGIEVAPTAWLVDGPLPLDSSEVFLTHDKALAAFNDWGKKITPLYALAHQPHQPVGERQILDEANRRFPQANGHYRRAFIEGAGWGLNNRAAHPHQPVEDKR